MSENEQPMFTEHLNLPPEAKVIEVLKAEEHKLEAKVEEVKEELKKEIEHAEGNV